ncbi:hypothetical protein NXH58_00125 [Agathobacter ruminis]|uniref:Uncharacterized protein n=2 Tax=Agathobacter ruminis TaxID=1712665 RepID=A0A2G3E0W0_9FIRM|nr:hypothetical protein [Agathobacter ruminis]MDC7300198.1 hypothetical protein [Agathobacter ruminis]PHU36898.1 hypothetical protein CSX02_10755 [Agathobacter ruminis]
MKMIKKDESEELFMIQEAILNDNSLDDVQKNCRIAILNTFGLIYDYDAAYDMLDEKRDTNDFNSNLIGAYLGAEWVLYKQNEMLNILLRNMDQYCFKQQAEIKYIEAIGKRSRGEKYMDELIQAIELCDSICAPYYELLHIRDYSLMKREELVDKIMSNTIFQEYDPKKLVDPELFIETEICKNISDREYMDFVLQPEPMDAVHNGINWLKKWFRKIRLEDF